EQEEEFEGGSRQMRATIMRWHSGYRAYRGCSGCSRMDSREREHSGGTPAQHPKPRTSSSHSAVPLFVVVVPFPHFIGLRLGLRLAFGVALNPFPNPGPGSEPISSPPNPIPNPGPSANPNLDLIPDLNLDLDPSLFFG
ncbi:unnamed protein product, partial [Discosporangium mesarthrocarpum]